MTREEITHILQENLAYLRAEFGVKRIGLFGSYAQGSAHKHSDIDLVVEFSRPIGFRFMEMAGYLEALLGTRVDLLTPVGVERVRQPEVAEAILESVVYV